jgi:hypothetical protein
MPHQSNLLPGAVDPSAGWDGKINGVEQELGTYVWACSALNVFNHSTLPFGFVFIIDGSRFQ